MQVIADLRTVHHLRLLNHKPHQAIQQSSKDMVVQNSLYDLRRVDGPASDQG